MVPKLREAFGKLEALSESEQEALAEVLINMLEAEERKWDELFARPDVLAALHALADEALEEDRRGETRPLEELL
jgi:DNA phosphorothioation-dependent restriction protein DptG